MPNAENDACRIEDGVCSRHTPNNPSCVMHTAENGLPHVPTVDSGVCSTCWLPWPCPVAVAWEQAHDVFCPRGQVCSTHLRPGDRYVHQRVIPPVADQGGTDA
jgi:hypothetical protein